MPMIAINLSDKLFHDIRGLIDTGRYASLESFLEIGAFNQLALERGSSPAELIERGHRRGSAYSDSRLPQQIADYVAPPRAAETSKAAATNSKKSHAETKVSIVVDVIEPVTEEEANLVFSRLTQPKSASLPQAIAMPSSPRQGEKIFGQVNRLFPIKFVCRWLADVAIAEGQWPRFSAVSTRVADDAGTIGSLLDQWDKSEKRERGGELATALPRRKNNASLDRFLSQFVARITRASEVSPGAVCQYQFAKFDDSALALTAQGVAFAELANPVLDGQNEKTTLALSDEEAGFLAEHIRAWVPTEWADMNVVIQAVQGGKTSPAEVATEVRAQLPSEWTESMVQTHISGTIARLSDIRLLRRSWKGRNVKYELGSAEQVNKFLGP
ncbi:MAG: hypothetical protein K2X38_24215 [Gemmataceae bacterium]|nr:hypothetical protein [Gemmataceae bacterium]